MGGPRGSSRRSREPSVDAAPGVDLEIESFARTVLPDLVGLLTIRTGDRDLAEDLAHETIARVWEQWARVTAMENPVGYCYRVALNLSASHWRRRRVRRRAESRLDTREHVAPLMSADAVALRAALDQLSERQRQIILLRFYLGYDVAGTAEVLAVSESTVKTQSARALRRLRSVIGEPDG